MFNLTVSEAHTYYVGQDGWLVHNDNGCIVALRGFKRADFQAGGDTFSITKERMTHFLERHHPSYWDGSVKTTQTFFDESLNVQDITNLVKQTGTRSGTNERFTYNATIDGTTYRATTVSGKVVQFFPLPK